MFLSIKYNHIEIIKYLLENNISPKDNGPFSPFLWMINCDSTSNEILLYITSKLINKDATIIDACIYSIMKYNRLLETYRYDMDILKFYLILKPELCKKYKIHMREK